MNASDIIRAKQSQILNKAYYTPTIFPGVNNNVSTLVVSTVDYIPYSSISGQSTSYTSSINTEYLYVCAPTFTSYELANDVNNGMYMESICTSDLCNENSNCSTQLIWKNTNSTLVYNYAYSSNSTTVDVTSTVIMSGPLPTICPLVDFYQGTSFAGNCDICEALGIETGDCCGDD